MLKSLKFKIILSSAVCILTVGVFSNVYLYHYLTTIISEKADHIDRLNLQTLQHRLDQYLEEFSSLGSLSSYDSEISRGIHNVQIQTVSQKREVLDAQKVLQRYLDAQLSINPYINRLMAFNEEGICIQTITSVWNRADEGALVMETDVFRQLAASSEKRIITVTPSIINGETCLVFLGRIYQMPASIQQGWLYIELSPAFIEDILAPYPQDRLFVAESDGSILSSGQTGPGLPQRIPPEELSSKVTGADGRIYRIQSEPLKYAALTLYSQADVTFLSADSSTILYTSLSVILASLATALLLAILLGSIITKPLKRLTGRLWRIAENDFSHDPAIEQGGDEIAEIGRVVNKMTASTLKLLQETEEMHIQRKNSEIALLQSQVNPHFLYNTLDSIRWLAVVQKNPGIEKTVRSLSNLLRNLAKGVGDKITIEEELSLLQDYVDTQSVRFMELLEFEDHIPLELRGYSIIKFTLQPLVENAIFHGIEPSGECGRILLNAREEEEHLLIFVEDNGVGMSEEELRRLREAPQNLHPGGMAKIGVMNVDSRLKLTYGEDCGLTFESKPGVFTRVTVRLKKEVSNVQSTAGRR